MPFIFYAISDIQCGALSNGEITLCSSGSTEMDYTCSFTCNTGYELTGSDTRTCQSDGSWSGNETMCSRGKCGVSVTYISNYELQFLVHL